jgi:hypothetical protein
VFLNESIKYELFTEQQCVEMVLEGLNQFAIISENLDTLKTFSESANANLVLSEDEKQHAEKAAEDYVNEVRGKVEAMTDKAESAKHQSQLLGWFSLGGIILGYITLGFASVSLVLAVVGVMALIAAVIASIVAGLKFAEARSTVQKMVAVKEKLKIARSRTKNIRVQDKIDDLLARLKQLETQIYYQDATTHNTTYNMN